MHYAVIDLGYGDSGKGILTARLTRQYKAKWNVKFTGGCQCAHNVITDDGRHHTFAQFGSGTFDGAFTYLTKDFLVEPFALLREADHLESLGYEAMDLMWIDPEATIVTPYHWLLNQWAEDNRTGRHGSTGRGIGMTKMHAIEAGEPLRAGHLEEPFLADRLHRIRQWVISKGMPGDLLPSPYDVRDDYDAIREEFTPTMYGADLLSWASVVRDDDTIIFEGSQGVLLDEDYGFHPHTTWSHTTDRNVHMLLAETKREGHDLGSVTVIGVTRSYMTRHGHGPFPSEAPMKAVELHNEAAHYQGAWRTGMIDVEALAYAVDVCNRIDGLYVTHMDQPAANAMFRVKGYVNGQLAVQDPSNFAERQRQSERLETVSPVVNINLGEDTAEWLSDALGLPLFGKGFGPRIFEGNLNIPDEPRPVYEVVDSAECSIAPDVLPTTVGV